jgi:hypothetical protein
VGGVSSPQMAGQLGGVMHGVGLEEGEGLGTGVGLQSPNSGASIHCVGQQVGQLRSVGKGRVSQSGLLKSVQRGKRFNGSTSQHRSGHSSTRFLHGVGAGDGGGVGASLGDGDGMTECEADGSGVDGSCVGASVSTIVVWVGNGVGALDGDLVDGVGALDGDLVDALDGDGVSTKAARVGDGVGALVGDGDGKGVGAGVGDGVGALDGDAVIRILARVGDVVGALDGDGDGKGVGAAVKLAISSSRIRS